MEEGGTDTCNENHTLGGKKCYQNIGIHGDELNENALCRPTGGATEDVMTRHKRRKHVTTACLLLAAFGIGATINITGPSLLDLQRLTGTTINQISTAIFVSVAIGWASGSLIGGLLYDRYHKQRLMCLFLVVSALLTVSVPWCTHVVLMATIYLFVGASLAASYTGTTTMLLTIWGANSGSFMQAEELCMSVGGMCGILLLEALTGTPTATHGHNPRCWPNNTAHVNQSHAGLPVKHGYFVNKTKFTSKPNVTLLRIRDGFIHLNKHYNSSNSTLSFQRRSALNQNVSQSDVLHDSNFEYLYMILGIFLLLTALPFMVLSVKKYNVDVVTHIQPSPKESDNHESNNEKRTRILRAGIIACMLIFFFVYVGVHVTYTGLITTFSVTYLCWSRTNGNLLPSLNWGTTALSKFLSIFLARLIKPDRIMVFCISMVAGLFILLTFLVDEGPLVLWICSAACGLLFAPIFPSTFTWFNNHVELTGTLVGTVQISLAIGVILFTTSTSWLFENVHAMWFLYVTVIGSLASALTLYLAVILGSKHGGRFKNDISTPLHEDQMNDIPLVTRQSEESHT